MPLRYEVQKLNGQDLRAILPPPPYVAVPDLPRRPYPYTNIDRWSKAAPPLLRRLHAQERWPGRVTGVPFGAVIDQFARRIGQHVVVAVIAPTGSGKTMSIPAAVYTHAAAIAPANSAVPVKCIIAVPTTQQVDSTYTRMLELYNGMPMTFGKYHGAERARLNGPPVQRPVLMGTESFVVVTPFLALKMLERGSGFTHIVIDEAHELNDTNHELLFRAMIEAQQRNARLILMSATFSNNEIRRITHKIYQRTRFQMHRYIPDPHVVQTPHNIEHACLTAAPQESQNVTSLMAPLRTHEAALQRGQAPRVLQYDANGVPILPPPPLPDIQMRRAFIVVKTWMTRIKSTVRLQDMFRHVCMVFLPGNPEITEVRDWLLRCPEVMCDVQPSFRRFNILRCSASNREDVDLLTGQAYPQMGRVVLTTNVLETGVTIRNVDLVVDTGIRRIGLPHKRNGFIQLETVWIDSHEMSQRAGRTGRTINGVAVLLVSADERTAISHVSNLEMKLHRTTTPTSVLSRKMLPSEALYPPSNDLIRELLEDLDTTGCISGIPADVQNDRPLRTCLARITKEFFHFFPDDRFARLVLYGFSGRFLAHAAAYAACMAVENHGLRMPTNRGRHNWVPRSHSSYSLNAWKKLTPAATVLQCESITLASIIAQALYDRDHEQDPASRIYFIPERKRRFLNNYLIEEIVLVVARITNALRQLGLLRPTQGGIEGEDIFEQDRNDNMVWGIWDGDEDDTTHPPGPRSDILELNAVGTARFQAALLAVHGDRVLPNSGRARHAVYEGVAPAGVAPDNFVGEVETESNMSSGLPLGVFYQIVAVTPTYNKAVFTLATATEYFLFGNTNINSVDPEGGRLLVPTNTVHNIQLLSEDPDDLEVILSFRRTMYKIPWLTLYNVHDAEAAWEHIDRALDFCKDEQQRDLIIRI